MSIDSAGLSPRVRGNPAFPTPIEDGARSIPACAGEPTPDLVGDLWGQVYPRVCGGTGTNRYTCKEPNGLSPRVRGNRPRFGKQYSKIGSIPACAGEPIGGCMSAREPSVYPRVCGGTEQGNPTRNTCGGLSPRVRGNLCEAKHMIERRGSIPACAGERSIPACAGERSIPACAGERSIPACAGEPLP